MMDGWDGMGWDGWTGGRRFSVAGWPVPRPKGITMQGTAAADIIRAVAVSSRQFVLYMEQGQKTPGRSVEKTNHCGLAARLLVLLRCSAEMQRRG